MDPCRESQVVRRVDGDAERHDLHSHAEHGNEGAIGLLSSSAHAGVPPDPVHRFGCLEPRGPTLAVKRGRSLGGGRKKCNASGVIKSWGH